MSPWLRAAIASLAIVAAPVDAFAYCRTTTQPVPSGFGTTQCYTAGLPLYWKNACVGFDIARAASEKIPLEDATTVIDTAFSTWAKVTCDAGPIGITPSDLGPVDCSVVGFNQSGANQNLIVFRDTSWPYNDPNNTLGLTTVTFNADTGEIFDADMEINATGKNLTTTDKVPANGYDLLSVVTHEAGHFLGLAHSTTRSATMYPSYDRGSSNLRSLTTDDIAGICAIYPTSATRSVAAIVAANGLLASDACNATPKQGLALDCGSNTTTTTTTSGCGLARGGAARPSGAFGLAVAGVIAAGLRRRRLKG